MQKSSSPPLLLALSDTPPNEVLVKEGWLRKAGKWDNAPTKLRFCRLWLDGRFEYATPTTHTPRGNTRFPRSDSKIEELENDAKRFNVTDPEGRTWLFQADSQEEKQKWIIAIYNPHGFLQLKHEIRTLVAKLQDGTITIKEHAELQQKRKYDPSKIGLATPLVACNLCIDV